MAEHFFASTPFDWVSKEDLFETIDTLHALSKPEYKHCENVPYIVCKVPLEHDKPYPIKEYVPQVDGTEVVYQGSFKFKIKQTKFKK